MQGARVAVQTDAMAQAEMPSGPSDDTHAGTVAVAISDHSPFSQRVLTQRAIEAAAPHFAALTGLGFSRGE